MTDFDPYCQICPRLSSHLAQIRCAFPEYHARPVAPFGDNNQKLFIVGLAPGMHGANATGRPFTGDHAGILLYKTLFRFGFANQAEATHPDDGLQLINCKITNAVKCLPPENKPTAKEITECNHYLQSEFNTLREGVVILALGRIAHNATLKALGLKQKDFPFGHGGLHPLSSGRWLLDSYHCSRYNTQTGRLTPEMFDDIFYKAVELLNINI